MIKHLKYKMERLSSLGYEVEKLIRSKSVLPHIESSKKTVILFDLVGDLQLNSSYKEDYDSIVNEFNLIDCDFIFLPNVSFPNNVDELIHYFIPHLNHKMSYIEDLVLHSLIDNQKDSHKYFSLYSNDYKEFLNYLGYRGNAASGFIIILESDIYIVKYSNEDILNGLEDPKQMILNFLHSLDSEIFSSRHKRVITSEFDKAIDENLDEEAIAKIKLINKQIEELKSSGKWLFILPLLKKTLDNLSTEIDLDSISTISIDDEYNIYLPYFNNLEIKLSHLTKVIYIFFYNHPEGIRLSELWKFEEELLDLYLKISNQNDYDKMKKSIEDITAFASKSVFSHISRIKSRFYSLMDESYAKYYIIDGADFGSDLKYIPLIYDGSNDNEEIFNPSDFF